VENPKFTRRAALTGFAGGTLLTLTACFDSDSSSKKKKPKKKK
jgi:hypothetical protein